MVYGVLAYLGGRGQVLAGEAYRRAPTVELHAVDQAGRSPFPSGERPSAAAANIFGFSSTKMGATRCARKLAQRFTVNLFDPLKATIRPRRKQHQNRLRRWRPTGVSSPRGAKHSIFVSGTRRAFV
jgi:hypothetical protein